MGGTRGQYLLSPTAPAGPEAPPPVALTKARSGETDPGGAGEDQAECTNSAFGSLSLAPGRTEAPELPLRTGGPTPGPL